MMATIIQRELLALKAEIKYSPEPYEYKSLLVTCSDASYGNGESEYGQMGSPAGCAYKMKMEANLYSTLSGGSVTNNNVNRTPPLGPKP